MADRDFKGVWIPREVWLDERLNALEKVILVEIDSLDCGENHCWKSNESLAAFCQCSATKVSSAISKLIKLGYIKVHSFDGRVRKLQSCLTAFAELPYKNCKADSQNLQESNTESNTLSISKNPSDSCAEPGKPASAPTESAVFSLPLNDGSEYQVTQADIDKYTKLYPAVDIMQELRKMYGWLDGNPTKKKTRTGIKRFINSWLSRAQDQGGSGPRTSPQHPPENPFGVDRRANRTPKPFGGGSIV